MKGHVWLCWLLVFTALGCTPNRPWRTDGPARCQGNACDTALIEHRDGYDLAFVEFTERGNVFSRGNMDKVLAHVSDLAKTKEGVLAIVFTHGWKHNAKSSDSNVESFREMLMKTAELLLEEEAEGGQKARRRHLVGVYIGWRGLSLDLGPLTNFSYWDRKAVAHQVGKGGVTELLLRLERAVVDDDNPTKNLYLVTGHSFGGATVLSALNEILLERVAAAEEVPLQMCQDKWSKPGCQKCLKTRPFGHGVVLLNPAIEANEVFQLKTLVSQSCFAPTQDRLMHVISSDADKATNKAFVFGQWVGVNLTWRQAELERSFNGSTMTFREADLDRTTVGNFIPFRTGKLDAAEDKNANGPWNYRSCVREPNCIAKKEIGQHIPAASYEPLAFIQTDGSFIADHNDIFNDNVAAYLAAIIAESRQRRVRGGAVTDEAIPEPCLWDDGGFDFGTCFNIYLKRFSKNNQAQQADQ